MKINITAALLALTLSLPAMADNVLEAAAADGSFKTFLSAIKTAGLDAKLNEAGPYTLFAPDDAAFAKLPKATLQKLLGDKEALSKLLSYHIVPAKISKADVDAGKVKTLLGSDLKLSVSDGVKVNGVPVLGQEIHADNGAIHEIGSVLSLKK